MVWHWIIKSWLQQKAQEKIYEAVAEQARQRARSDEANVRGGAAETTDVAILFSVTAEAGGLEDMLEEAVTTRGAGFVVHQGRLRGKSVLLVVAGAGHRAAQGVAAAVIAAHRPGWVISAGFAGALAAEVRRRELVFGDVVLDEHGNVFPTHLDQIGNGWKLPAGARVGRLLTVDRVVRDPEEKKALAQRHQAVALDMTSTGVARACGEQSTGLLAVRIVGDEVDERLPSDLEHLMRQESAAGKLGAVIGSVFRRPSSVKDMLHEKEEALLASDRLAAALADLVESIGDPPAAPYQLT
jgi:adenosylhomocysteine nucleosidase